MNLKFQNFKISACTPVAFSCHNLESHNHSRMESDCKEITPLVVTSGDGGTSSQDTIMHMLSLLSDRMMSSIQDMQHQLVKMELKFSTALEKNLEDNENFKRDIRTEIQQFRSNPIASSTLSNSSAPNLVDSSPVLSGLTSPSVPLVPSAALDPQHFHNRMMSMLTATVSKLSTIVGETKSNDSKSDWPKFSGDIKKFKHWCLAIVAQLSLAPWKEFYDSNTNTLLKMTTNTSLNEKLYAKLLLSLEGQVFQDMVSRKHLRGDGLRMLTELSQTYRPSQVPEVMAAKTVEFWSTPKHLPHETVDAYYNRFQAVLDDLEEAGEPTPIHSATRQFIFTLGSDFLPIQNNHRIGLLPAEWTTTDWPSLLVLRRNYSNSVRPQGNGQDNSDSANTPPVDRPAHHKKIKQWFMNPVKFKAELEAEQAKYTGGASTI